MSNSTSDNNNKHSNERNTNVSLNDYKKKNRSNITSNNMNNSSISSNNTNGNSAWHSGSQRRQQSALRPAKHSR